MRSKDHWAVVPVGKETPCANDFGSCKQEQQPCFDSFQFLPSSGKVVAVKIHYLVPRRREVLHKRFLRVVAGIDFGECPEL